MHTKTSKNSQRTVLKQAVFLMCHELKKKMPVGSDACGRLRKPTAQRSFSPSAPVMGRWK